MKKKVVSVSLFVIILFLVAYVLRDLNLQEILNLMQDMDQSLLALAFLVMLSNYFVIILRWKLSLSPLKRVAVKHLIVLQFAGLFINTITPGAQTGGEPVRAYYLGRLYNTSKTKFFGATLADKTFNLIAIVIIVAFSILTLFLFASIPTSLKIFLQGLILLVILIMVVGSALYMKKYHLSMFEYILKVTHRMFMKGRFKKVSEFKSYVEKRRKFFVKEYKKVFCNKKILVIGILLSFLNWALVFLASFILFYAFNNPISYISVVIVASIAQVMGDLSPFPGGVGMVETTMFLLYSLFSIPASIAISVAVLVRSIHYFYAIVCGSIALSYAKKKY